LNEAGDKKGRAAAISHLKEKKEREKGIRKKKRRKIREVQEVSKIYNSFFRKKEGKGKGKERKRGEKKNKRIPLDKTNGGEDSEQRKSGKVRANLERAE